MTSLDTQRLFLGLCRVSIEFAGEVGLYILWVHKHQHCKIAGGHQTKSKHIETVEQKTARKTNQSEESRTAI